MATPRQSRLELSLRTAVPADIPAMVPVINAAYAIETFIHGSRTDEDGVRQMMTKGQFLLTEDSAGQIAACVYAEVTGERGYFGVLAVNPSQQGRGLGRIMIQAAEDYCRRRGCKCMEISVLSMRTELLPFYHKLGYAESRIEEFHSSRPLKDGVQCHCIIMSKQL